MLEIAHRANTLLLAKRSYILHLVEIDGVFLFRVKRHTCILLVEVEIRSNRCLFHAQRVERILVLQHIELYKLIRYCLALPERFLHLGKYTVVNRLNLGRLLQFLLLVRSDSDELYGGLVSIRSSLENFLIEAFR